MRTQSRARRWLHLAWALVPLLCAAPAAAQPNLTVDGAQPLQTLDGVGVNINVNSWDGGQLRPALDALVDVEGASVMRVIRDPMDWVSSESLIPALHNLDPTTLQQVYEAPKMQDIWNVVGYLNQKGLRGNAVMLNFMGWTPTWLGGSGQYGAASYITPGKESEWATMVASLVYYGKRVRSLDFQLVGPLNEEDANCLEGPCVDPTQYVVCLQALLAELGHMGLTDVRLVAPDTAGGPDSYLAAMTANATVTAGVAHFGMHAYGGPAGPTGPTGYTQASYWLTETAASCGNCDYAGTPSQGEWAFASQTGDDVISDLGNGFTSVLIYDGYDSFYYHHDSMGFWGLLSYDLSSGVYTPRKRMYVNAQIAHFVRPGFVQVRETDGLSGPVAGFYAASTGDLTIVGHNSSTSPFNLQGALQNVTAPASLSLYLTSAQVDLQRASDVAVVGGTFSVQIPADTFFTLTTVSAISLGGGSDGGTGGGGGGSDAGTSGGGGGGGASAGGTPSGPGRPSVHGGCNAGSTPAWLGLLAVLGAIPLARRQPRMAKAAGRARSS